MKLENSIHQLEKIMINMMNSRIWTATRLISIFMFMLLFVSIRSNGAGTKKRNVIFILSDDHRYDFMGFMKKAPAFLKTPAMDRMAELGAHLQNAFVTTSLCSPSRACILTGRYMHSHHVVDNQRPVPEGTIFFPELLQAAGYETAFIGKWHMGHGHDDPRPGFDYWVSFPGQGKYFDPVLNINGKRKQFKGYNDDVLTKLAVEWIEKKRDKPFFLYLSYKSVHYPFVPPKRYQGLYKDAKIKYPETMANTEDNYQTQPRWVRERRYSIHGIDHMQTGAFDDDPVPSFDNLYHGYCEAVHGLDENLGRVIGCIDKTGLSKSTLVIYMGDNGFELGEHGFYDKRDAFEESIRVPMLAYAPGLIKGGTKISKMVLNIDIASTVLDIAGVTAPESSKLEGMSFLPLLQGKKDIKWRDYFVYEYYWEWNFPATPTTFAIRTNRYKYIYYHGVWDIDGFYDLETDPHERYNLINVPTYKLMISGMKETLFDLLEESGGLQITIRKPAGERLDDRKLRR